MFPESFLNGDIYKSTLPNSLLIIKDKLPLVEDLISRLL